MNKCEGWGGSKNKGELASDASKNILYREKIFMEIDFVTLRRNSR